MATRRSELGAGIAQAGQAIAEGIRRRQDLEIEERVRQEQTRRWNEQMALAQAEFDEQQMMNLRSLAFQFAQLNPGKATIGMFRPAFGDLYANAGRLGMTPAEIDNLPIAPQTVESFMNEELLNQAEVNPEFRERLRNLFTRNQFVTDDFAYTAEEAQITTNQETIDRNRILLSLDPKTRNELLDIIEPVQTRWGVFNTGTQAERFLKAESAFFTARTTAGITQMEMIENLHKETFEAVQEAFTLNDVTTENLSPARSRQLATLAVTGGDEAIQALEDTFVDAMINGDIGTAALASSYMGFSVKGRDMSVDEVFIHMAEFMKEHAGENALIQNYVQLWTPQLQELGMSASAPGNAFTDLFFGPTIRGPVTRNPRGSGVSVRTPAPVQERVQTGVEEAEAARTEDQINQIARITAAGFQTNQVTIDDLIELQQTNPEIYERTVALIPDWEERRNAVSVTDQLLAIDSARERAPVLQREYISRLSEIPVIQRAIQANLNDEGLFRNVSIATLADEVALQIGTEDREAKRLIRSLIYEATKNPRSRMGLETLFETQRRAIEQLKELLNNE